ncbi:predicted protein [Sclerotinia sclerotiorum 1980 UF-70]|uniref:Chaperone/heat shock protein Hsp12 n=2 Tax=Sclerotinia sclerotiorum (strain ATCC 18683 / 1980 / Ss-1) TaxID=665079 RepID=A7EI65_SCLS1|nr:predicted protein [Sclerotinia sclerotiorum 1980 UF-70]APA11571.1 hypothetical protein sscle_08g063410 [Sclerotinia sclerotiorum 1980 UF-70]EDO02531.1 predicted protein [Sclerotinia sclerotiorum 1980 UF-70]
MSDNLRKGVGEQVSEKITPDSQKSTTDKLSENISGGADKAASAVQPSDQKSTTQQATDKTRSGADDAQNQGKGILGSVSDTISNTASSLTGNKDTK